MKTFKKRSQFLSLFFIALLVFQSCHVYTPESSTLDEATTSNRSVKIHTKEGKRLRYKRIFKKEGLYYGVQKRDTVQIDILNIERLRLKNNALSTVYTVLLSAFSGFTMLIFIGLMHYGM